MIDNSTPNIVLNYTNDLNSLLDLYQAHRKQHPDFFQCGGVGACLMMRTEAHAEQDLEEMLRSIAESGYRLRITLAGDPR